MQGTTKWVLKDLSNPSQAVTDKYRRNFGVNRQTTYHLTTIGVKTLRVAFLRNLGATTVLQLFYKKAQRYGSPSFLRKGKYSKLVFTSLFFILESQILTEGHGK